MKTPVYIFLSLLIMQLCPMQLQSQTQAQATVYNGLVNIMVFRFRLIRMF